MFYNKDSTENVFYAPSSIYPEGCDPSNSQVLVEETFSNAGGVCLCCPSLEGHYLTLNRVERQKCQEGTRVWRALVRRKTYIQRIIFCVLLQRIGKTAKQKEDWSIQNTRAQPLPNYHFCPTCLLRTVTNLIRPRGEKKPKI